MIDLECFRDWVATQLQEKTCKRIARLKQDYAKKMFSETCDQKPTRIYTTTNSDTLSYKVAQKSSD